MITKGRCFFLSLILILFVVIPFGIYKKYEVNRSLEIYSHARVLSHTQNPKNVPLIEELYRLGGKVEPVKGLNSKQITDPEQKSDYILLSKICKDSCLPLRCRMDPGLGHACRINCPAHKIKFCITSLKPLQPKTN